MTLSRAVLSRSGLAAALAAATLALTGCSDGVGSAASSVPLPANAPALEQAYISVVQKELPSVVQITTDEGLGSGVVFDGQGNIVTNAHVVGSSTAPGLGFAIPSNLVTDIAGQIVKNGRVINSHRAALGVRVLTVVGMDGEPAGMGVVSVVPGGPAAAAGLRPGDVITAVNNTPVHRSSELAQVLAKLDPGQAVPITVTTDQGASRTITVTLGELPGS
jgi:S1-C subfamily serine protease